MTPVLERDEAAYFDRLAEVEAGHWWSGGMWRIASHWLDAALRGRRGLRALDVGCGAGLVLARLAARAEIDAVAGLDPSREALGRARRRHGWPLVRGSALALPFGDATFDVATCFDVFQHLPAGTDRRAAAELRRVLRPGGIALVRANGRGWGPVPEGVAAPYRLSGLTAVLSGAGLRVARASRANCLPALAQELRGRLRPTPTAPRPHPAGGGLRIRVPPPWINRLMGGVAAAEALAAGRLGLTLPFGHSTMVMAEKPDFCV